MRIGGIVLFLVAVGAIVSWIIAAVRAYKLGGSKGMGYFLMHLLSAVAVVFVLWLIIVYPVLNCHGFLCGLGEVLMWMLISTLNLLVWPIVLLFLLKKKYPDGVIVKSSNEELLDDL